MKTMFTPLDLVPYVPHQEALCKGQLRTSSEWALSGCGAYWSLPLLLPAIRVQLRLLNASNINQYRDRFYHPVASLFVPFPLSFGTLDTFRPIHTTFIYFDFEKLNTLHTNEHIPVDWIRWKRAKTWNGACIDRTSNIRATMDIMRL